jgi:hypothetical protein
MDHYPDNASLFPPEYEQYFFIAMSKRDNSGIMAVEYGFEENKVLSVPRFFVRYRGDTETIQQVTGLAFGADGLYFAPVLPNQAGHSPIFKVTYEPEAGYPYTLAQNDNPLLLMNDKGCFGCHSLYQDGELTGGAAGPSLEPGELVARLDQRLNSEEYVSSVKELDSVDNEPQRSYGAAREQVLAAAGRDKIRHWLKYHILEPRFDTLYSQMPNLGLSEEEALLIADYLLDTSEDYYEFPQTDNEPHSFLGQVRAEIDARMMPLRYRDLGLFFTGGFVLASGLALVVGKWFKKS